MDHLYITDDDSNKNKPREDYVRGFGARTSRRTNSPPFSSRALAAAASRGRFDDLEIDGEDEAPAFDFQGKNYIKAVF
jgi:hypothetical protein